MTPEPVIVELPRVLANLVGVAEITGTGNTLGEVLADIAARQPGLNRHFFDEAGQVRRHIRFLKNEAFWRAEPLTMPLAPGDRVTVINSVSGG